MTSRAWWKESVVYQIYPRSFQDSTGSGVGDLNGIRSRLDHLEQLGIDVIWLSPVYDSPNDDNGYDIRAYDKIMKEFGTMKDWEQLLEDIHGRGMRLVMDLVVNHSSDEHAWFAESRSSMDNKYRDYYIWRDGRNGGPPNNWGSVFGGSAWEYDTQTASYYLHLFSRKQPDLNWENEGLRQDIYKMMTRWLDKGVDGFRMDVINFISKAPGLPDGPRQEKDPYGDGSPFFMNGPRIHEHLQEMHENVLRHYDIMTVGEMPGVNEEQAVAYTKEENNELNMVFQFEHMDLDAGPGGKWDLRPCPMPVLRSNLTKWQKALEHEGWNSLYWNNHDQPRVVSRFGNDAAFRKTSAKMLALLLHMMKGTPFIYQGEEIGMTNVQFEEIADYQDIETINMYNEQRRNGVPHEELMHRIYTKGRDNARTPMQWDSSKHAGFTEGTPWLKVNPNYPEINAAEAMEDQDSIFYFYQQLIRLRHEMDIIVYGSFDLLFQDHPEVFCYERRFAGEVLQVYCSFSTDPLHLEVEPVGERLIGNYGEAPGLKSGHLALRPFEAAAYYLKS
ncbi:glycoside hydrolase family 13 protein [Alkalicoccus chagannorensis]|uniref:glycoside hydrolase family 13 protein n=1 Tax=Alkalicoccus chagannorensis TaxID=427072 RepID=UPI0004108327|nr:alpha-glucosidase [Alkalicoccus chagannorensis]